MNIFRIRRRVSGIINNVGTRSSVITQAKACGYRLYHSTPCIGSRNPEASGLRFCPRDIRKHAR